MEYTSQGQGALNTVLGAIGTYGAVANGSLGNILGGLGANNNNNVSDRQTVQNILDIVDLKTENAILKASIDVNDKIKEVETRIDSVAASQAVVNCGFQSSIAVLQNQATSLLSLTKMAIPNNNICPGWGAASVTVSTGTTTA